MKTHEKDGIIYFDEPFVTQGLEFAFQHIGCDFIFSDCDYDSGEDTIIAYASSGEYNHELQRVRDRDYPAYTIQQHMGEWAINGI